VSQQQQQQNAATADDTLQAHMRTLASKQQVNVSWFPASDLPATMEGEPAVEL
jgi:hypothetical protein